MFSSPFTDETKIKDTKKIHDGAVAKGRAEIRSLCKIKVSVGPLRSARVSIDSGVHALRFCTMVWNSLSTPLLVSAWIGLFPA